MRMLLMTIVTGICLSVPAWADGPTVGEDMKSIAAPLPSATAATVTPPAATLPVTTAPKAPATNSAEAARDKLFGDSPKTTLPPAATAPAGTEPVSLGTVQPVGPNEPKAKLLMEGTLIYKRVGRLSKDAKSGQFLFTFDSDGTDMRDPPMFVLPSKTLGAMESLSENGARPVRFQITGEVTEYKGKNYLLVHAVLVLRDLNTGISGN